LQVVNVGEVDDLDVALLQRLEDPNILQAEEDIALPIPESKVRLVLKQHEAGLAHDRN